MCKTMISVLGTLALIAGPVIAQQSTDAGTSPQVGQQTGQLQTEQQQTRQQQTGQTQIERQQTRQQRTERVQTEQRRAGQQQPGQRQAERGPAMRASDLTGIEVRNEQNEDLGEIDDLVIDLETGQVRYAALSVGGVLGIGDDLYAIPWNAFRLRAVDGDHHLVLNVTSQKFENAPGFDKDNWPNMADPQWQMTNDRFYIERGISTTRRDVDRDRGAVGTRQDGVRTTTERQERVRQQTDRPDGVRVDTDRTNGVQVDVDVERQDRVQPRAGGTRTGQDSPQRDN